MWSENLIKDDACKEIEQLPSVTPTQKWIPVSERLPKYDGGYKERAKNCPLAEIVICEDCKYCVMTELGVYCDRHIHRLDTHLDKYCADGERRE